MKYIHFLLFILVFNLSDVVAQCECGEDAQSPSMNLTTTLLWSVCDTSIHPPLPIATDDCTLEPIVSYSGDTTSISYCGISPVFSTLCNHIQPMNATAEQDLGTWGPYIASDLGFRRFEDGTSKIYGTLRSLNFDDVSLFVQLSFTSEMTWEEYSAEEVGNSYFSGCIDIGSNYTLWSYLEIDAANSFILGQEALTGTILQVAPSTSPANRAFQFGQGASGVLHQNGFRGPIEYTGNVIFNGASFGNSNNAILDLFGLVSCCDSPYINAVYTATDLCLNERSYPQSIEVRDDFEPLFNGALNDTPEYFCDQVAALQNDWIDGCGTANGYVFIGTDGSWKMGVDQCGNYALSEIEIELSYPVGATCPYFGCTDPNASGYSPSALYDDGSCNLAEIRSKIFIDANANGQFDSGEITYSGLWLRNPSAEIELLSSQGEDTYVPYNFNQEWVTIELLDDPNDELTPTTPLVQTFPSSEVPSALFFGMAYDTLPSPEIEIQLIPEQPLCEGESWEFNLHVANNSPFPVEPGLITINLPPGLSPLSVDNLYESDSTSIVVGYPSLEIGAFANQKVTLLLELDSVTTYETLTFIINNRDASDSISVTFPLVCPELNEGEIYFYASPLGIEEELFISPEIITYYGIFTNSSDTTIQELDLTFFPDINTSPFDASTFSANFPFSIDRTINPTRYNIHFDNLDLIPNQSVGFSYQLDATNIQSETVVNQRVHYAVDNAIVQTSDNVFRTVVRCTDFTLGYTSNVNECSEDLILSATSNYYSNFFWNNNEITFNGNQVIIARDSLVSPNFMLTGLNASCQINLEFELDEIHTPRTLYLAQNDSSFCAGDTISIVPTTNASNLLWYDEFGFISNAPTLEVTQSSAITVVAPESGPCPSVSRQFELTQIDSTSTQLMYSGDELLCGNENLLVTGTGSNGQTLMFVNNEIIEGLTFLADGAAQITATTTNVCFSSADTLTTLSSPNPSLSFILDGDTVFCEGDFINIDLQGVGNLSLTFNANPVQTWPINVFNSTQVLATASNVCDTISQGFSVIVHPEPSDAFVYDPSTQTLTAEDQGSYQWLLFGNPIANATNQSYSITETGAYSLEITSEFGCFNSSGTEFINYINLQEVHSPLWSVFPNPAEETIYLHHLDPSSGHPIRIFNMLGQQVYHTPSVFAEMLQVDVSNWSPGIYEVQIGAQTRKLVIN